jgi:RNA polymerase-binding transcription factor DksA
MDRSEIIKRIKAIKHILATRERPAGYWALKRKRVLPALEQALAKIDAGTYGIRDDCRLAISEARPQAAPGATRCLDCRGKADTRLPSQ